MKNSRAVLYVCSVNGRLNKYQNLPAVLSVMCTTSNIHHMPEQGCLVTFHLRSKFVHCPRPFSLMTRGFKPKRSLHNASQRSIAPLWVLHKWTHITTVKSGQHHHWPPLDSLAWCPSLFCFLKLCCTLTQSQHDDIVNLDTVLQASGGESHCSGSVQMGSYLLSVWSTRVQKTRHKCLNFSLQGALQSKSEPVGLSPSKSGGSTPSSSPYL